MEFKDIQTPLDSKFFPEPVIRSLENRAISRDQFVSEHTTIEEKCTHQECVLCGGSLSPKASTGAISRYLGQHPATEFDCLPVSTDKCQHKFHVGCFDCTESKKCPICNEYWYSDLHDLAYAIELQKHLLLLDLVNPDDLLEHLSWIHSGDPVVLDVNFFLFCVLTVAHKLQNSVIWEFSIGRMSRPIGYFGGIEKHQAGRFVIETIIETIKELSGNEDEEPGTVPSGKVEEFTADQLRRDGQGHKVLRHAPYLLGGRLSAVWRKVVLKIVQNESLAYKHACYYYGAQVLALAAEHYLSEVEPEDGSEEDFDTEDDWNIEEDSEIEESEFEESANQDVSALDLNEVPQVEEDPEDQTFMEQ